MKPVKHSELLQAILEAVGRPQAPAATERAEPLMAPTKSLRILLAEDGKTNQRLAQALLEKWGHTVTIADNGAIAVQRWSEQPFDLVLMDVQMPEMDGFEATQRIRQLERGTGRHTPIIAMTARAMKGDREKCLEAGMDEYVSKPIRQRELYAAIAPLLAVDAEPHPQRPELAGDELSGEVVNWQGLLERVEGDRSLLNDLLEDAVRELPRMLNNLEASLTGEASEEAHRIAHTIKGTSRSLDIDAIAARAEVIEQAVVAHQYEIARENLPMLRTLVERALAEFQERLGRPA